MLKTKPRLKKAKPKKPVAKRPPRHGEPKRDETSPLVDYLYRAYLQLPDEAKEEFFLKLANEPRHLDDIEDLYFCFFQYDPKQPTRPFEEFLAEHGLS